MGNNLEAEAWFEGIVRVELEVEQRKGLQQGFGSFSDGRACGGSRWSRDLMLVEVMAHGVRTL